jgi:flagellar basal body-associated protein FliL
MEADAAKAERRRKEAQKRRQAEIDEIILISVAVLATLTVLGVTFYFVMEAMQRQY